MIEFWMLEVNGLLCLMAGPREDIYKVFDSLGATSAVRIKRYE